MVSSFLKLGLVASVLNSGFYPINQSINSYDLILRSNYMYYGNSDSDLILDWDLTYIDNTDSVGTYTCTININMLYESINTDFYISPFISEGFYGVGFEYSLTCPYVCRLNNTYGLMFRYNNSIVSSNNLLSMFNVYYYNLSQDYFYDFNAMICEGLFSYHTIMLDGYSYVYFENVGVSDIFNSSTNLFYTFKFVSRCFINSRNENVSAFLSNNNFDNSSINNYDGFSISLSNMVSSNMVSDNSSINYNKGFEDGKQYGYNQGLNENPSYWSSLWTSIWLVPSYILGDFLNFEIFGVNLQNVLFGLITTLIIIGIIGALLSASKKKKG